MEIGNTVKTLAEIGMGWLIGYSVVKGWRENKKERDVKEKIV